MSTGARTVVLVALAFALGFGGAMGAVWQGQFMWSAYHHGGLGWFGL